MPRPRKPARLVQRWDRATRRHVWIIRDGDAYIRTGLGLGSREEAEKRLSEYVAGRMPTRIGPAAPGEITVGEVLARYADGHAPNVADPERIGYAIQALAGYWGDRPVGGIKGDTCRAYARQRRREGAQDGTIRRELGCLAAALNWCVAEKVIDQAPVVTRPKPPPPKTRWLTRDEAARLLAAARTMPDGRHVARFIVIALYSGRRKTAILELRADGEREEPHVDLVRSMIYWRGSATETAKRRGQMRMGRRLAGHMARFVATSGTHVVAWRGRPLGNIRKGFARALAHAAARWPETDWSGVTPHVLKHTALTWAIRNGMSREGAERYFATTADTIRRVYEHHSPDFLAEEAGIMDRRRR